MHASLFTLIASALALLAMKIPLFFVCDVVIYFFESTNQNMPKKITLF